MHAQPESPSTDREFLDWAFDQAVEQLADGRPVTAAHLIEGRAHLRPQVEDVIRLAQQLDLSAQREWPQLQGYTILEELGQGGMGCVYLARQERLGGRPVALKLLPFSSSISQRARDRFLAEARAIASLQHANIVAIHDVLHHDGVLAYAMEWIDGISLQGLVDRLKAGGRTPQQITMESVREVLGAPVGAIAHATYSILVCRIVISIARALGAVHRAGLLHRDVKPSNILLRRDGTALLSDFGLVRDSESAVHSQAGQFLGTMAYAAPEQLRGDSATVGERSDTYSLGVTLYSASTMRLPFRGGNPAEMLQQIESGQIEPPRRINPNLPEDLQTIITTAIDPDPLRRYATADELANDLERLLTLQPIKARPTGIVTRGVKLARRNRRSLAAATIGGALSLGVVGFALTYIIGFPAWSNAHLEEARLAMLDPQQSDALYAALFWYGEGPDRALASESVTGDPLTNAAGATPRNVSSWTLAHGDPLSDAAAATALTHYDAAVRFSPFDTDLRMERSIVRLARDVIARPMPGSIAFRQSEALPLTAAYAARTHAAWKDLLAPRGIPTIDEHTLLIASPADLRSLGLLAMLCGDPNTSMAAWSAFDLKVDSDALVEAYFGVVYLISEQYGRAYPRLRKAVEAFPTAGFLLVYLAESATHCGDHEKAQQWLDEARAMPRLDRFDGLARVQAGLHAATGEEDAARMAYELLFVEARNIVAHTQYARFLEARGELEHAMVVHLHIISADPRYAPRCRQFIAATERWWASLTEEDRLALASTGAGQVTESPARRSILPTYIECVRVLDGAPPADGLPRTLTPSE